MDNIEDGNATAQPTAPPTPTQPSDTSKMDEPSATPREDTLTATHQMDQKSIPETILPNSALDTNMKDSVQAPKESDQISGARTFEESVVEERQSDGRQRVSEPQVLHIPEEEGNGSSSQTEPTIIPESQESFDPSKEEDGLNSKDDIRPIAPVGNSLSLTGGTVGAEKHFDVIPTDGTEITLDRGIAQIHIQGTENQCKPDDTTSEVIDVVKYVVKTVDDHLEGRIDSLAGRTGITEPGTAQLGPSNGLMLEHLKEGHVAEEESPMDVDPAPSGKGKAEGKAEEKGAVMSEVAKKDVVEGNMVDKVEDDIDEAWKSEDFDLPPSDEEGDGNPEPPPHVIVELYQRLEREKVLDLEWTCLGRRTPDEDLESMVVEESDKEDKEEEVNKPVEEDPTEFDFDIDTVIQNKVTPRRIPGFEPKGSGSAKKRVAKMDKVIDDIIRFSKINEEMEKTGDSAPPTPADLEVTPQRPLGKFHIRRDLHQ